MLTLMLTRPVFLYCGVMVLGWYRLCGALVGGLLVGDCVGVFGWLPVSGVVGLRSGLTLFAYACAFDGFLL